MAPAAPGEPPRLYFHRYSDLADVTPGAAGFLQTSGELLNFHPHVHVLVTDGEMMDVATRRRRGFEGAPCDRRFTSQEMKP